MSQSIKIFFFNSQETALQPLMTFIWTKKGSASLCACSNVFDLKFLSIILFWNRKRLHFLQDFCKQNCTHALGARKTISEAEIKLSFIFQIIFFQNEITPTHKQGTCTSENSWQHCCSIILVVISLDVITTHVLGIYCSFVVELLMIDV